jgi:hypothetical protein
MGGAHDGPPPPVSASCRRACLRLAPRDTSPRADDGDQFDAACRARVRPSRFSEPAEAAPGSLIDLVKVGGVAFEGQARGTARRIAHP